MQNVDGVTYRRIVLNRKFKKYSNDERKVNLTGFKLLSPSLVSISLPSPLRAIVDSSWSSFINAKKLPGNDCCNGVFLYKLF